MFRTGLYLMYSYFYIQVKGLFMCDTTQIQTNDNRLVQKHYRQDTNELQQHIPPSSQYPTPREDGALDKKWDD